MKNGSQTLNRALAFCLFFLAAGILQAQIRPDALQAYRDGEFDRSVEICLNEIIENPNNIESHVVIAWSLIRLGRFNEAMAYSIAGRNLSRYDIRIIHNLGEISYHLGQNSEALQFFREYISLAPPGARVEMAYYYMGEIYIRMGRFRHADIALSTAVHRVPGNALWWTRLAFARENAGDLLEAVIAYERALSLNPQLGDAQRGLERARQELARR
jgi:tetratricopeptide (TPR) repeat protein